MSKSPSERAGTFVLKCNNAIFFKRMKNSVAVRTSFFVFLFLLSLNCYSQKLSGVEKIDPLYRQIITLKENENSLAAKAALSHYRIQPTAGFALKNGPLEKKYECIVYTSNPQTLRDSGIFINSALPTFATAWVSLEEIKKMAEMNTVKYITAPAMNYVNNDIAVANSGASLLHAGKLNNTAYKGKNVLMAIYDSGIDWDHFDFRDPNDPTKSRILRIWDQTLNAQTGEAPPAGFSYGVEYTQSQINDELDGTPANFVREADVFGHGTHVAGTAAGNGSALPSRKYAGMAPEADLIIIKGGDSLFDESKIIDGMTYLRTLATTMGKPIVLNMSLGNQFGPHDGTRPYEIAVDNFTSSATGRAVVISAGNDNGKNLHNNFSIAGNTTIPISFTVPAGTGGTEIFKYRLYTTDNGPLTASLGVPGGDDLVTANANEFKMANVLTNNFTVTLSNFVDPANNNRYIDVAVERNGSNTASPGGTWRLSVINNTTVIHAIDGWLYYISPSFNTIALVGGNSQYLVGSPGNAASAITVASYVSRLRWYTPFDATGRTYNSGQMDSISTFSSRGPRRDNVQKPEIAAPGQAVISCLSSNKVAVPTTDLIVPGMYHVNQGTSMSAPCVAGAIALLLQAKPNATAVELKNLITSTATKDAWTELPSASPNSTWGYGRLDVYKAASSLFNCVPANHKSYQYDNAPATSNDAAYGLTSERMAVRFSPDISGKLGGVFFHTSFTIANLVIEVRASNAGVPGNLLGFLNIDSVNLSKFSLNYIDLNALNVSVTSGTDYFIVLARNAANSNSWSLFYRSNTTGNRSLFSTNGGTSWLTLTNDLRIRTDVYVNGQLTGTLAVANSSDTRNINTSNRFINNNCALIAQLVPSGANAVNGNVTAKVWLESAVPSVGGNPYVSRHYEITPETGAAAATGRVTLYFSQAEFNAYNAHPGSILDLPANPTDNAGKANLRIGQFAGTSNDGSGLPDTYTGTSKVIDPADTDIIWSAEFNRWEISFDITGFSGFIVQTSATTLPITLEYFKGEAKDAANVLTWKVNCGSSAAVFEIERSSDVTAFANIGSVSSTQARCLQPFTFNDASPKEQKNYYRIKIVESNGRSYYTGIILLQSEKILVSTLFPTIVSKNSTVQIRFTGNKGMLTVNDEAGRRVHTYPLVHGSQSVALSLPSAGIYFYKIIDEKGPAVNGKIFVK